MDYHIFLKTVPLKSDFFFFFFHFLTHPRKPLQRMTNTWALIVKSHEGGA